MHETFYTHQFKRTDIEATITLESNHPGHHIVLSGSVHGSEPSGTAAIVELLSLLETGKLQLSSGSITLILGNPEAFKQNKRYLHHNLNRVFDKKSLQQTVEISESYEKVRAQEMAKWIEKHKPDVWIDLHSTSSSDEPMAVLLEEYPEVEFVRNVSNFETYFMVSKTVLDGSLMQFCLENGVKSVTFECGSHTSPKAKKRALDQILSTLSYLEIITPAETLQKPEKVLLYTALASLDANPGFTWKIDKQRLVTGELIPANELLAVDDTTEYSFNTETYLMMPDANPTIGDKAIAFVCSKQEV